MRTVYLGTSEFAAGVLARLADSPHAPALVVTRPERPRGRGRKSQPTPVAVRAEALGIACIAPEALHAPEVVARIEAVDPERLIVCAYGVLIREPILSLREILNVHPSHLPRWRGAAPIERAIIAGDESTAVAIMRLTEGLDSGPVALLESAPIVSTDDYGTLAARLEALGGELLVRALDEGPPFEAQSEEGVTYAEKVEAADRALDPAERPEALARLVRALHPHIGARIALPGDAGSLGVLAARVAQDVLTGEAAPPGGTLRADGDRLLLDARGGALELTEVRPPGGNAMAAGDWLRGRPVLGGPIASRIGERPVAVLAERAREAWMEEGGWIPEIEALGEHPDVEGVLAATDALASAARPAYQRLAAIILGSLGASRDGQHADEAGARLVVLVEQQGAHTVLSAVADALGRVGPSHGTNALLDLHRHPDAAVREAVARALAPRRGGRVKDAVALLAQDTDPRVRAQVGRAAG